MKAQVLEFLLSIVGSTMENMSKLKRTDYFPQVIFLTTWNKPLTVTFTGQKAFHFNSLM